MRLGSGANRALVPQHLQPRALDQGAGDRGHAQGDPRQIGHLAAREKAVRVAQFVGTAVEEPLTYYAFPEEHWRRIRTNNPLDIASLFTRSMCQGSDRGSHQSR